MNVDFKLVWFENEDATIRSYKEGIQKLISSYCLIPDIITVKSPEFNVDMLDEADLIFADYDLETDNSVSILENIVRKNDIVVDALLYSSQHDKMINAIKEVNPFLEGIYCVKREYSAILDKLKTLINKIVKRSESVENLRGLVMEYSSLFDKRIIDMIVKYVDKGKKDSILLYINNDLLQSQRYQHFKICMKTKGILCSNEEDKIETCKKSDCCYYPKKWEDVDKLIELDFYSRSRIFNNIIQSLISDSKLDVTYKDFFRNFYEEIIVYRNALAHQNSTDKRLYIKDKDVYVDVDSEFYRKIRSDIIKYNEQFKCFETVIVDL